MPYRLGIDLGTTNTVATVSVDGAAGQPVALGVGRTAMRSAVYLADGRMLVGDQAAERGLADPSRLLLDPRRQLGTDRTADLGGQPVTPEQATTTVLRFVRDRARAQFGGPAVETVLSYPARWTPYQLECFDRAVADAELGPVRRCSEAEAAAAAYAGRVGLAEGGRVVVYDLGGGSCAAAVLEQTPGGPRILGTAEGSEHPCGADFDEAVLRLVLGGLGERGRDLEAGDPGRRSQLAQLRQVCVQAKEALSTESETVVRLPGGGPAPLRLSRRELESLVRPALRDSAAMVTRVLGSAAVPASDLAALVLVGGGCRMPVVAELLGREIAAPVAVTEHPEDDVALGALWSGSPATPVVPGPAASSAALPAAVGAPDAVPADDPAPAPDPAPVDVPTSAPGTAREDTPTPVPAPAAPVDEPEPGDGTTVVSPAPIIWTPAVPADPPPPGPAQPPAPDPEQTMPQHVIFDYFTPHTDDIVGAHPSGGGQTVGYATAPAASSYPPPPPPGPQRPNPNPPGQYPPAQYPPAQYPPGQLPSGGRRMRPGPPAGYQSGPPTQPYGTRGPGGPGGGQPPGPGGSGPFGSRRRLIIIVAGIVVLIGAAVALGFVIAGRDKPVADPAPSVVVPVPTTGPSSPAESATPSTSPTPADSTSPTPTAPTTSSSAQTLPAAAAIPQSVVVVPMKRGDSDDRPLYLVDTDGKIDRVKLTAEDGQNSNPMMQPSRSTIIYLNSGALRVMASDGSGDRKLFNRDPAGCDNIQHASWSLADPKVLLISCQISKNKDTLLVIGMDGQLIRRLDAGKKVIGDFALSPDGQTVLYWASDLPGHGGSIYTLPMIGTGDPKRLTDSAAGVDDDPAWSPDGTQIAFRRNVPDGTAAGNDDVFVMNADGSAIRGVATTKADDIKPVWSPDGKNLLIVSNRKSAFGGPGKTYDLWLTRVSDGEVLAPLGVKAKSITRPFWTLR